LRFDLNKLIITKPKLSTRAILATAMAKHAVKIKKIKDKKKNVQKRGLPFAWGPTAKELGEVIGNLTSGTASGKSQHPNIYLPIMPYSQDGSIYGSWFPCGPMFVMHCIHDWRPSVFFKIYERLTKYIEERNEEDAEFPETREALETTLKCKFVFTKGDCLDRDLHNLFQPWRIAIYMTADMQIVKNVVIFIDAFVHWVCTQSKFSEEDFDKVPKMDIQVPVGFDLELTPYSNDTEEGDMECPFTISQNDDFTVKVTDAPPPISPARLLVATIEASSKNTIVIIWSGNTSPFRKEFEKRKISGTTMKLEESDQYSEYYRRSANLTIHDETDREQVLELFGEKLTKNTPVVVRVRPPPVDNDSPPTDDDALQILVKSVKKLSHCFFVA